MITANECYEKFKDKIKADNTKINMLFICISAEISGMLRTRNIKTAKGAAMVVKELNVIWNEVADMYEKEFGDCPIAKDGFMEAWALRRPELQEYLFEEKAE